MFFGTFYCLKQMFNAFFKIVIKDITFVYCLNLKFKDEDQYFGLIKMSMGNV